MPRELLGKIDLDLLFPPFVEQLLACLALCKSRGALFVPYFGFRSFEDQFKLYKAWKAGKGGRAAPPGLSAHQYGLAVDCYRQGNKGQALWLPELYSPLIQAAAELGLHSGVEYKDRPHISWPGYVDADDLIPLKNQWLRTPGTDLARLRVIWDSVPSQLPKQQR